ncbi:hypothetical protein RRG08_058985 [Elysia crispata]|uniref:Uncharacterized protein n=1 Tax=Elysia crispata TaxID=231223 RepID=A0AAE1AYS8_9GAST|nr:hypothetical protein RRG08_058985 [Elysia crispata]
MQPSDNIERRWKGRLRKFFCTRYTAHSERAAVHEIQLVEKNSWGWLPGWPELLIDRSIRVALGDGTVAPCFSDEAD